MNGAELVVSEVSVREDVLFLFFERVQTLRSLFFYTYCIFRAIRCHPSWSSSYHEQNRINLFISVELASMSRQRQTFDEMGAAYNSMDLDRIMELRSEDCVFQILPSSLGTFFYPCFAFLLGWTWAEVLEVIGYWCYETVEVFLGRGCCVLHFTPFLGLWIRIAFELWKSTSLAIRSPNTSHHSHRRMLFADDVTLVNRSKATRQR